MRKQLVLVILIVALAACGTPDLIGGTSPPSTTTTLDPEQPVDSGEDEPVAEPGPVGSIPEPRLPIDGNIDSEVWVTSADLRIMESFPIQVMLDVTGEKPTPCHEVFWTAEDAGDAVEIVMISQVASAQSCTQVIEEFIVAVPLGSWADEARDVYLNGELVGSFES